MTEWIRAYLVAIALMPQGELSRFLVFVIEDWSMHFLLAFLVGLSVYSLTWITLYVFFSGLRSIRKKDFTDAGLFMSIFPFLAALSVALLSHYFLDYVGYLWLVPLGESLFS